MEVTSKSGGTQNSLNDCDGMSSNPFIMQLTDLASADADESVKSNDLFVCHKLLNGTFTKILASNIKSGAKVFLKSTPITQLDLTRILTLEANLLHSFSHPHIVRILGGLCKNDNVAYILLEYLEGGDLLDYVLKTQHIKETDCRCIMQCVLQALSYIHSKGFIHGDIKPDNLMFTLPDDPSSVKLIDFGTAKHIGEQKCVDGLITGTAGYIAPEMLNGLPYDYLVDIYSLGITFHLVLTRFHPFYNFKDLDISLVMNKKGVVDFSSSEWSIRSTEVKHLISQMVSVIPSHRPTATEALQHPWFSRTDI